MSVEGSSQVYHGGSVVYSTKRGLPFLLNDSSLQQQLLDASPRQHGESDGDHYVRQKLHTTEVLAKAFLHASGTDYAVAEGGAAGPTFRQEGLDKGFSALAVAKRSADGTPEVGVVVGVVVGVGVLVVVVVRVVA